MGEEGIEEGEVMATEEGGKHDSNIALGDRLLDSVGALEHLLSLSILPEDFDMEALASCDAEGAAECEKSLDIQDRVFGFMVRALPVFAVGDSELSDSEYSLESKELHGHFLGMIESEMETALSARGWDDFADFQASLRAALSVGGGGAGSGNEEGLRVRRGAAAADLLELLDAVTRFEQWADAMKRRGRELLELRG